VYVSEREGDDGWRARENNRLQFHRVPRVSLEFHELPRNFVKSLAIFRIMLEKGGEQIKMIFGTCVKLIYFHYVRIRYSF